MTNADAGSIGHVADAASVGARLGHLAICEHCWITHAATARSES
jgi:hypothetical protein